MNCPNPRRSPISSPYYHHDRTNCLRLAYRRSLFDYLIPEEFVSQIVVGKRVKVSFGPRPQTGCVTGLLEKSSIARLKPILSILDASAIFNDLELTFAQDFAAYYGCSLGEALFTILRNKENNKLMVQREHTPVVSLHRCSPDEYAAQVQKIIDGYPAQSRFLILVPDAFRGQRMMKQFKGIGSVKIGMRSSVFESDGQHDCVIMVDEEDASYKQEQTPMYETRQVLRSRSKMYGFDIAFVGVSPSVEMMALVRDAKVKLMEAPDVSIPPMRLVDLTNYKFVPGLISPPVREVLEAALKKNKKSLLVLNRRGSYRMTRCVDCAEILEMSAL